MKLSSSILVLALAVTAGDSIAATNRRFTVDYTRAEERFAPSTSSQRPQSKPIEVAPASQVNRVHTERRSFATSPVGKPEALRPTAVVRQQRRISNHFRRPSAPSSSTAQLAYPKRSHVISPEARRVGRVSRYQNRLSSTDAVYIGRTPSFDRRGTARLNRFLFSRNDTTASVVTPVAVRAGAADSTER